MSFLDRITGRDDARSAAGAEPRQPLDDALPSSPMEATVRLGQSRLDPAASGDGDSSIISEASPSELAGDFGESRHLDTEGDAEPVSSGLPVIGGWPLARQQRALAIAFGLGGRDAAKKILDDALEKTTS